MPTREVLIVARSLALERGLLPNSHKVPTVVLRDRRSWLAPDTLLMDPDWYCRRRYSAKMSIEEMARKSFEANLAELQRGLPGKLM